MPLDPTLVRGLTPIAMPERDPNAAVNQLGMMMKLQELQSGMQANQLNAQKYQREANEAAALAAARAAYDPNNPATERALFGAGGGADLQNMAAVEKSRADAAKQKRDAKANAFTTAARMIGPNGPALIAMLSESANDAVLSEILGIRPQHLPVIEQQLQANPENVTKLWRRMVGVTPKEEEEIDVNRQNVALRRGELDVSQRNATVAEDRQRRETFDMLTDEVNAGRASAGTNVSEETAAYHVKNLVENANLVGKALAKEPEAGKPGLLEATVTNTYGLGGLKGATQSAQRQVVDQSNQQILDSVLYLATGAAYNKEQRMQEVQSLIPKYFDKPEALAAQKRRLLSLIAGGKIRADSAWTPELEKEAFRAIDLMYKPAAAGQKSSPAASEEDIAHTAKLHGISPDEVRRRLGMQ